MSKRIVPYPRINSNEALKRLGVEVQWDLQSVNGKLSFESLNEYEYRITDKIWSPASASVKVVADGKIRNIIRFFDGVEGNAECAIANRESVIGVAFQWRVPKTGLQGVVHCKDIVFNQSGELLFGASLEFPPMIIRFQLEIDVVIYMKAHSKKLNDFYAKVDGALLGPIAKFVLQTGGSGGYFPTEVEENKNGPLWRIHSNILDPEDFKEDFDSAMFCLVLNKAHPLYDQVYVASKDDKVVVSPLMFEIFANCCYVLVRKACEFINDVDWTLHPEEKDDLSVLVNFKALKRSILSKPTSKDIIEMEPEELMLRIREALVSRILIDNDGGKK